MDIYTPTEVPCYAGRPNCWTQSRLDQPWVEKEEICSASEIAVAVWCTSAATPLPTIEAAPQTVAETLIRWGHEWMWDNLMTNGDGDWINEAIREGTCTAVADGSFIFILECSKGQGTLSGSFAESSSIASAFRRELLGLMAIHLILLAAHESTGELKGRITIHSDCKGALKQVRWLPPLRIPVRWSHADILKVILRAHLGTSCLCKYKHVLHQDDKLGFYILSRPAQLNCLMDAKAKRVLLHAETKEIDAQQQFPTETITCYVENRKVTSELAGDISFGHTDVWHVQHCVPKQERWKQF